MTFGISIKDQLGDQIENSDAITSATDSRVITGGTSGTYTVPASSNIITLAINNSILRVEAALLNSTTVSYTSASGAGDTAVITFL